MGTDVKKFAAVKKLAEKRKGGAAQLLSLLPTVKSTRRLIRMGDDRFLSAMTQCIFQAGFNWSVVQKKWPQCEAAFLKFDIDKLLFLSPEKWEAYMQDSRVIRNWQKISTIRVNAELIAGESKQHNGFGRFLAQWPAADQIGLMKYLKKHGGRLGGQTAQWFLRCVGKDGFIVTRDVVRALQNSGLDIKDSPTSQNEWRQIQQTFNAWQEESDLSYTHISKIAAFSAGTNYDQEQLEEVGLIGGGGRLTHAD